MARWITVAVVGLMFICPRAEALFCRGDCDGNGRVSIDEIVLGVRIVLEEADPSQCVSLQDAGGAITVDKVVAAVNNAVQGCPRTPTPWPFIFAPTPTPTPIGYHEDVDQAAFDELVAGNTDFALALYHAVRNEADNLFFSPHSISVALAMLYAGAANETARQMADASEFRLPPETLHPTFKVLHNELATRAAAGEGADGGAFRLNVANRIWGQDGYPFLATYIDALANDYGAGLGILDFTGAPEESRQIINGWVSEQTEQRIPALLGRDDVDSSTRLILTNAVYFNAAWKLPFEEEDTRGSDFDLLSGERVPVQMMNQKGPFSMASSDGYKAVELLYDGDQISMLVMVPDAGRFEEFEDRLDANLIKDTINRLRMAPIVYLGLPKFTYRLRVQLREHLAALGMRDAFIPGAADLSGIDGTRLLYVDFVVHEAFIKVNEAGTEAAAATGIGVGIISVPPSLVVNRPFIYVIRDRPTGAILFIGRVLDPR